LPVYLQYIKLLFLGLLNGHVLPKVDNKYKMLLSGRIRFQIELFGLFILIVESTMGVATYSLNVCVLFLSIIGSLLLFIQEGFRSDI
jgi:hypothetical protein